MQNNAWYIAAVGLSALKREEKHMIRIAIVDDNPEDSSAVEAHLERFKKEEGLLYEVDVYDSSAAYFAAEKVYDALFLDIEMPGESGMTLAEKVRATDERVAIVFITNMAQYAIDGYKVSALDFVLKPITYYDFVLKFKKVLRYIKKNAVKLFLIKTVDGERIKLSASSIYYVEVMQHYLTFHTKNGAYNARGTISAVETELAEYNFSRCAKSYLINLSRVKTVKGNAVVLADGTELYISRTRKKEFLERLYKLLGGGI